MPNGQSIFGFPVKEISQIGGLFMGINQVTPCIFCGSDTEEEHTTSIGVINIHFNCLVDLEEVLAYEEELEEVKV
jgi:hypothetical protein